jgi:hypothetical protein
MPSKRRHKQLPALISVPSSPELGPRLSFTKSKPAKEEANSTSEQASISDFEEADESTSDSDASSIRAVPLALKSDWLPRSSATPPPSAAGRTADVLKLKPVLAQHGLANHLLEASSNSLEKLFPRSASPSPNPRRRAPSPSPTIDANYQPSTSLNVPGSPRTFAAVQAAGGRRFRLDVLSEVSILTLVMGLACYRIASLPIANIFPPAAPLIVVTILMPFMTLFRRSAPSTHLMVPFTDERGYRERSAADDGFPVAVALPILLSAGAVWDCFVSMQKGDYLKFEDIRILPDMWNATGLPAVRAPQVQLAQTLLTSRICLLVLTTINVFVLIFHLILARTVLRVNWLPLSNTKRFFGALTLALSVSGFAGGIAAWCARYGHGKFLNCSLVDRSS